MKWYVVAVRDDADPDEKVWTVSTDPNATGWETDGGFPGYGLLKSDAEFLVAGANEKFKRNILNPGS